MAGGVGSYGWNTCETVYLYRPPTTSSSSPSREGETPPGGPQHHRSLDWCTRLSWTLPQAISHFAAFYSAPYVYIAGGVAGTHFYNEVYRINPSAATPTWEQLPPLPSARSGMAHVVVA
jgi:hypothetical protein